MFCPSLVYVFPLLLLLSSAIANDIIYVTDTRNIKELEEIKQIPATPQQPLTVYDDYVTAKAEFRKVHSSGDWRRASVPFWTYYIPKTMLQQHLVSTGNHKFSISVPISEKYIIAWDRENTIGETVSQERPKHPFSIDENGRATFNNPAHKPQYRYKVETLRATPRKPGESLVL
ncbi:uncharacterized protein PgNI_05080 [Pyricularia grisea]|uniref:Uncharacterized protein n=1 Tax=Pyricularia grisea TaxID=148305 RepID=A0A6P8B8M5_PYRGI|nr:uncharacterized protein PgNI_05080 [Pyricularia grisea]TLD12204.1 hypothetical protein PgNI_05080 [Pyricularia grisea]